MLDQIYNPLLRSNWRDSGQYDGMIVVVEHESASLCRCKKDFDLYINVVIMCVRNLVFNQ